MKRDPKELSGEELGVYHLLIAAADRILAGEPESAVWRAVDAAGIAAKLGKANNQTVGFGIPTGLGFRLATENPSSTKIVRRK